MQDLPHDVAKQQALIQSANRAIWRTTIKPLIGRRLIAEHRSNPYGKHSSELDQLLNFLRNDPLPDRPRLVGVILKPGAEWAIGEHPRRRGVPVRVRSSRIFSSPQALEHAIFLERLKAVKAAFEKP